MMRNFLLSTLAIVLFVSCGDKTSSNDRILFDSSGNVNHISVVVSNELWNGSVGESIRNVLLTPIYGLPQDEPMFSINQIPTKVFSDFITRNRSILKIELGKETGFKVTQNVYAKPQKVIVVSGKTKADVIKLIKDNSEKILQEFKNEELREQQRRISKSLYNAKVIEENLGLNIKFQTAYRIVKTTARKDEKFFWIKKDFKASSNVSGDLNILLYQVPLSAINRDSTLVTQVIKMRDSIGKKFIHGTIEGSYMATEDAYTPFNSETIIDNKPAFETKGIWDLKEGTLMAGPFINYAIEDKINNRWVIAEGFVFAPSIEKRNYMFELEAIIKSIKIK
ncbi:DUF4837 family protein [Sabulilitoribacter arenilitoris]|uniref:DUF4837 family protein n=1 Tax=Wocania arenilitoris TaxID=2044858 RepID=A0AAE3EMX3_9FLAO|nr:DUF4837 family protein [Wocania arenilitoris]MCF7566760.1 DUF4837 family protein [Wocania arenilitoris]